ncbi:hypothetical protein HBA55_36910 [Pseudomaricurvus alkylphenolicus]|uniref:hypothetical protein n=1 Tax=Pseudomaricurvus alkylphenolicus TaxID=1306991 RepID=UPI001421530D|nr:hypothetical protein [Pseudomaricurvus alkylphenolicus]NIB45213.1 hypothetical protein [Pseudomaricurvus alkylphenolicus]
MNHKKYSKLLIFLLLTSSVAKAMSREDMSGIWIYENFSVYLDIPIKGKVFQCRIAENGIVITAYGTLIGIESIIWGAISAVDSSGKKFNYAAILPKDFTGWGKESISFENESLILNGDYGPARHFRYKEIPPECEYQRVNS